MRTEEKICNYIDIPLQHVSDRILSEMNRNSTSSSIRRTIDRLREAIPDIHIRTTFITGFPGESEDDFEELCDFVQEVRFDRMGVFSYSQEENTPAANFDGQIDEETKIDRRDRLMAIQQQISLEKNKAKIGSTTEVLCEGYDEDSYMYFGRSYADAPEVDGCVFFTCDGEKPKAGDFVKVRVTDYTGCDPVGEFVGKID